MQAADDVRNAMADAMETTIGLAPILRIRSGAAPADVSDADTGTVVAEMTLPNDWLSNASAGVKGLVGSWADAGANAANAGGTLHWRIYTSAGVSKLQGTVTVTGGGGELTLDNLNIASGQPVTVTSFTFTQGG